MKKGLQDTSLTQPWRPLMQIKYLHKNIYKLSQYALSHEKRDILRKRYEEPVEKWEKAKKQGCDDAFAKDYACISRASYFRYKNTLKNIHKGIIPPSKRPKSLRKPKWEEAEKQLVLRIRRENPTYGKAKIAVILKRDHALTLSESTVGRILKHLMVKGLIQLSASAPRLKRKRRFSGHAKPWIYGMKASKPGDLIQIDHMSIHKNQVPGKHFQAWDPTTRFIYANIYNSATSMTAKGFLMELLEAAPFQITSIQVDGGSEFMKDFESACAELHIQLFVLPPRRPQWNGGVERGNRIFREEFYSRKDLLADSITSLRAELQKALLKYNTYRPHKSLNGLTPMHYSLHILKVAA